MSAPRLDEADQVREAMIAGLRKQNRLLLAVLILGALAAILGGPAAVQALQVVQGLTGAGGP